MITGFVTRVIQRWPLVGPELLTFPEHRFIEGPCYSIFSVLFCCLVDPTVDCFVCPSFLFTIALSFLRITFSDYPFSIPKPFISSRIPFIGNYYILCIYVSHKSSIQNCGKAFSGDQKVGARFVRMGGGRGTLHESTGM